MSRKPKILAFAGSLRSESFTKKLVRIAAQAATDEGAEVTVIDLKEYPLPIFDQDLEQREGPPENALKLKQLMIEHDGFLIASPEYNSSITAALKNAIDWASRPAEGEPPLVAFRGKAAAIMSASPGGLGGLRGLVHIRAILGNIGILVLPDQIAVPAAHELFDEAGDLKDEKKKAAVEKLAATLATTLQKLVD